METKELFLWAGILLLPSNSAPYLLVQAPPRYAMVGKSFILRQS